MNFIWGSGNIKNISLRTIKLWDGRQKNVGTENIEWCKFDNQKCACFWFGFNLSRKFIMITIKWYRQNNSDYWILLPTVFWTKWIERWNLLQKYKIKTCPPKLEDLRKWIYAWKWQTFGDVFGNSLEVVATTKK